MHELAQENFRANLQGPAGEAARSYLARRGVSPETVEQFGLGYSDRSGRALLRLFEQQRFTRRADGGVGLVRKRDDGSFYDYFRNRLMFPIHNESGKDHRLRRPRAVGRRRSEVLKFAGNADI